MTESLSGTTALVTGASSGIGAATAIALADAGATVALAARRTERLEQVAEEIDARAGTALVVQADITDRDQAIAAVERTIEEFGRLDTVINNAGIMLLGQIEGAPVEEWDRMIAINLQGSLYVTHAALPHLLAAATDGPREVADIVNISSVAGRVARAGLGAYNLTKHGIGAFSESLRQEVTERHVRVSLIEPGAVDTELAGHMRPEVAESMRKLLGDQRNLDAEDVAAAISFVLTRPRHVAINEVLIRPTESQ